MDVCIRTAGPGDAEVVALLGRITFAETFGHLFREHQDDLRAYLDATFGVTKIERSLGKPENAYWLARVRGLPVGYAKLKHPSATALLAEFGPAQLQKIYLLAEFLGRGVGRPLLDAALDRAAILQASAVWLAVLRENGRAIAFYNSYGFAPLGDADHTIGAQTFRFRLMASHRR